MRMTALVFLPYLEESKTYDDLVFENYTNAYNYCIENLKENFHIVSMIYVKGDYDNEIHSNV